MIRRESASNGRGSEGRAIRAGKCQTHVTDDGIIATEVRGWTPTCDRIGDAAQWEAIPLRLTSAAAETVEQENG